MGIIPARYASTRFPGKILSPIAGKTLIQRTYENAKRVKGLDALVVATDDEKIFKHVKEFAPVVMTSPTHQTGTDRLAEVLRSHSEYDAELIVNIQGDEPCIDPHFIEKVIEGLKSDPEAVMGTAVTPLAKEDAYNRAVVKCVMDQKGRALYFSRSLIPAGRTGEWQEGVDYFRHVGLYVYRRNFLLKYAEVPMCPLQKAEDLEQLKVLEAGYKIHVVVVEGTSIGVDTPEDIQKVEKLICQQNYRQNTSS